MQHNINVQPVSWKEGRKDIEQIRERVFVSERRVPWHIEFDGKDRFAHQVLGTNEQGEPVACGRITNKGMISRISVVRGYRRQGVGELILNELLAIASRLELKRVSIAANLEAVEFYTHLGFQVEGKVYMEGGLPRQHLSCDVSEFHAHVLHRVL